jgi:hypothetical protein
MSPGMGGYSSVGGAVRKMWAEEGIRGFYKGLYPNLLKVGLSSIIANLRNSLPPLFPESIFFLPPSSCLLETSVSSILHVSISMFRVPWFISF